MTALRKASNGICRIRRGHERSGTQLDTSGPERRSGGLRRAGAAVPEAGVRPCGADVPHAELAEEAAQEAFLAAWQGLPFFRGDSAFATWLYRLTSNACVDLLRKENRHQGPSLDDESVSAEVPDPTPTPEKAVEQQELRRQIEAGLQTLSPEHREVLILREIQQLSYDEIADVLSLDLGPVKSRINRGRRQLREFLLKQGNFLSSAASNKTERGL